MNNSTNNNHYFLGLSLVTLILPHLPFVYEVSIFVTYAMFGVSLVTGLFVFIKLNKISAVMNESFTLNVLAKNINLSGLIILLLLLLSIFL